MTSRREVSSLIRRTIRDLDDALRTKIAGISSRDVPQQVQRNEILPIASAYIDEVQPLMANIEEFSLSAAAEDWPEGVRGALRIAGHLMSMSETLTGFRFATGLPAYLGWRLLLLIGAAALHEQAFTAARIVVAEPVEVELLGRQVTHASLPERRKLFYPEAFLGYAHFPIIKMRDTWESHFNVAFNDQGDYREGLVWILVVVALLDTESEGQPIFPGYRIVDDAGSALGRFVARLAAVPEFAEGVAGLFDEDAQTFRQKWPERAQKANAAELGPDYWHNGIRIPEALEPQTPAQY